MNNIMIQITKTIRLVAILCSLMVVFSQPAIAKHRAKNVQKVEDLDSVVAVVNDDVITERELQKRIGFYQLETNDAMMPPVDILRSQVLNLLIDQIVAMQTASRFGLEVSKDTVDQAINDLLKRNNLSKEKLKNLLVKQKLTFKDYQNMVQKELIVQQVLQKEVAGRINIPKQEVDKYLNSLAYDHNNVTEYLLSDILISLPDVPSSHDMQKANAKAERIIKKLAAGGDFKELAVNYSEAPNALQGGSLGWRRMEEIPSLFAEKVEAMRAGEYIGPIKTPNGIHILKLQEIKGAKVRHVFTEHKTRHILIKVAIIDNEDTVKAKLVDLRDRIKKGESFKDLAKQYSQDPVSAAKGGSLGWVPPGVMVAEFEKTMKAQKIGEVSKPFRSEYGWHILVVESKREQDNTQEYYANELRKKIYQRKFAEESQNFIRRLRNMSFVDILLKDHNTKSTKNG